MDQVVQQYWSYILSDFGWSIILPGNNFYLLSLIFVGNPFKVNAKTLWEAINSSSFFGLFGAKGIG